MQKNVCVKVLSGITLFAMVTGCATTREAAWSENQAGTAQEIYTTPTTAYVAEFMGGWNVFKGKVNAVDNGSSTVLSEDGNKYSIDNNSLNAGSDIGFSVRRDKISIVRGIRPSKKVLSGGIIKMGVQRSIIRRYYQNGTSYYRRGIHRIKTDTIK